jgi:hypothetical protein
MRTLGIVLAAVLCATGAQAQTLPPLLADVAFLMGDWHGDGRSEKDHINHGTSSIHLIVGGNALLRKDHTDVTDKVGKKLESFDQIMLIYPEGGTLHADYLDGGHVIHYTRAGIEPGRSVAFHSDATATAPEFTLTYTKTGDHTLGVNFAMHPPGAAGIVVLATGTLKRD